jgi:hypothetical protein
MPRKKKEKSERVTTTNIKVTVDTHQELQVAAELTGMKQSEVISAALRALLPNLTEEVDRREMKRRETAERINKLKQN